MANQRESDSISLVKSTPLDKPHGMNHVTTDVVNNLSGKDLTRARKGV